MTAKELVTQEIENEIKQHSCFMGKSFIPFRSYLDPVMDCLVEQQLDAQRQLQKRPRRQLVATCCLAKSGNAILKKYY